MAEALAERSEFCATLRRTDPDSPTLCGDWTAALLTAHLVQRERSFTEALGRLPVAAFQRRAQDRLVELVAERSYAELVDEFEAGPPVYSPWAIPVLREAVNVVEYAVHHEDVRRVVDGVEPRDLPVSRQRRIWQSTRLSAPMMLRRLPVGVRLIAPGFGTIASRAKDGHSYVTITGAPLELTLFTLGRQRVARVDYDGADADIATVVGAKLAI